MTAAPRRQGVRGPGPRSAQVGLHAPTRPHPWGRSARAHGRAWAGATSETHLRAPGQGDDAGEQVPNHVLQTHVQALHMDGVDEAQAVLHGPQEPMAAQPAGAPVPPRAPAACLTLNTSAWSSRDTSTSVFGANSWPGGPGATGDSRTGPPSSTCSSRTAASSVHRASCGQEPCSPSSQARPTKPGGGRRGL